MRVYGLLQFAGNTYPNPGSRSGSNELALDGQTISEIKVLIGDREIVGYGEDQLGDEAHLYLENGRTVEKCQKTIQAVGLFLGLDC